MRKMLLIAGILLIAAAVCGCSLIGKIGEGNLLSGAPGISDPAGKPGYGGDPVEFEHFKLSEQGMSAESEVIEGIRTASGVKLEYYLSYSGGDDEDGTRIPIHTIEGGKDLYDAACALLGNCRIVKWNGFNGANPPGVLDGYSMSFEASLSDGSSVNASGSNNFPPNYGTLKSTLTGMITYEKLTEDTFTDGKFEVDIPENWKERVFVHYAYDYRGFCVKRTDGDWLTFYIIDCNTYGYTDYQDSVKVGRLVKNYTKWFVTARKHNRPEHYKEKLPEDIISGITPSYDADCAGVTASIRAAEGYELKPEDGSVLYEAEARELFDKTRSMWLYFDLAGEYSKGAEPTVIDGRNYIPVFPSRSDHKAYSIDALRNVFRKYFTAEYADKLIDEAAASGDIVEHGDELYTAFNKSADPGRYSNYWLDEVRDNGDGTFTVNVIVRKYDSDDVSSEIVTEFPVVKNEEGKFVFADFPYWDKHK